MSNIDSNEVWLVDQCKSQPWFFDVGKDQFGCLVVYVKYMDKTVITPDFTPDGQQVKCHYAGSLLTNKNKYFSISESSTALKPFEPKPVGQPALAVMLDVKNDFNPAPTDELILDDLVGSEEEEKSVLYLQKELDKLEKICGSYTLQDIFYEVQDKNNAVTDLSARYPEVRKSMERLYKLYGFDTIYEELDG